MSCNRCTLFAWAKEIVLYSKFLLSYLHIIHDQTLGKATPLLVHVRSHLIRKGLQPYKGTHAYINWFRHLIVQR